MSQNGSFRPNRRTVIKSSAVLAGSGLAIGGYSLLGSEPAHAEVQVGSLNIPSSEFTSADGQPDHIWLFVDAIFDYKVAETPASVMVSLYHRDTGGGYNELAPWTATTTATSDSRTVSLRGDLIASNAYSPSDFAAPGAGQSKTVTADIGLLLQILDADGAAIRDASVETTVDFQVTEQAVSASVGGEGSVVYQDDGSDPTPTPP